MSNLLDQQFPDEEEEDDFNPGQHVGSDDEDDAKPQADDEDGELSVRRRPASGDDEDDDLKEERNGAGEDEDADGDDEPKDDDDEEDEEEEEDEDDEDDDVGRPTKRRKQRRNQFIDVEAEVDEDDEEEPEEEDDLPGEEMHPDDLQELPPGADRDDRMHRELDRKREQQEAMDVEETAARLKERYGRQNRATGSASGIIPQRLLMPSAEDPRIWFMKCRPGKEREIIFALQSRIVERQRSREPVQIFSAFERAGTGAMAGKIYVEARRLDDVTAALDGITHVFMGTKPQLIPVEEMPALLRVKKSKQLEPGMYVRPKRGLYAGDLAMVDEVEPNGTEVQLKLIPRLDYGTTEDANAAAAIMEPDGQGGMKRKRIIQPFKQRPPARLFSETEAKRKHGRYLSHKGGLSVNIWTYQGKEYVDGFLIESFKIGHLQTEDVNPTLEEVTKFAAATEDGTENLDLAALAATLKAGVGADYLPGDKVEIFRGEQKGVTGRATQVYNDVIRIEVDSGLLAGQAIEAPIRDLRKLFKEGDHVKVIGGSKYQDEVGMVVRLRDDRITILTDSNQQEITVFAKDLREATDSGGVVGASKYDLFDLVQLDASTVGCVVKVDRESLRVLDQLGGVRALLPSAISNKIEKRREGAPATDHQGNEIKSEDTVKEYGGESRQGKVLHVHRGYVFAQSRESRDNAGVFVARTNNVLTVAAKGGRVGPDLTKMNQALNGPGGGAAPMPPPMQKGRDKLIGRTVKIKVGPMKAMIGIVKESSDAGALVELHSKNKKVTMPKEKLAVIDATNGQVICSDASTFGFGGPRGLPGRGPPIGGATPGRPGYGAPPMASGGRTPAYAMGGGGGRTPAWKADGGRTPAWQAGGGGGQTAYGGGGGMTSYGGQTSYGGATSYGGGSVWGGAGGAQSTWNPNAAGGRTPAYVSNSGGKTPAYSGSGGLEAPTPGAYSAPTPGAGYADQPTPAYRGAAYNTPANYAATPVGFPETPAPYSAETPAASDDGPRYD
ncbi:putative ribosomal protein L2, domain 2 [Septoria linicola]|nr:putative ribosomal protein L2, domain 2 [Septoria linicola]